MTMEREIWADKYEPKMYSDLLTDEITCWNILIWLSSWNPLVFKKEFKKSIGNKNMYFTKTEFTSLRPLLLKFPWACTDAELDFHHQRCLVIAGDTGIGKTSLIKTLTKQCGYEPIFFNINDETNVSKINERIVQATSN